VHLKTSAKRSCPVFASSQSRQGNYRHFPATRQTAKLSEKIVAILFGHSDIAEHDVGPEAFKLLDGGSHAASSSDLASVTSQNARDDISGVDLVLNHEHLDSR
jgi:hypothetical protein